MFVEVETVAARTLRQREDRVLVAEVPHDARALQPARDGGGCFVLGLEGLHQPQPQQIRYTHFHGHGAAACCTTRAQTLAVARPGVGAVDVDAVCRAHAQELLIR